MAYFESPTSVSTPVRSNAVSRGWVIASGFWTLICAVRATDTGPRGERPVKAILLGLNALQVDLGCARIAMAKSILDLGIAGGQVTHQAGIDVAKLMNPHCPAAGGHRMLLEPLIEGMR